MRPELKYWRDLSNEERQKLKSKHKIQTVTYSFIKMVWEEINKKQDGIKN